MKMSRLVHRTLPLREDHRLEDGDCFQEHDEPGHKMGSKGHDVKYQRGRGWEKHN